MGYSISKYINEKGPEATVNDLINLGWKKEEAEIKVYEEYLKNNTYNDINLFKKFMDKQGYDWQSLHYYGCDETTLFVLRKFRGSQNSELMGEYYIYLGKATEDTVKISNSNVRKVEVYESKFKFYTCKLNEWEGFGMPDDFELVEYNLEKDLSLQWVEFLCKQSKEYVIYMRAKTQLELQKLQQEENQAPSLIRKKLLELKNEYKARVEELNNSHTKRNRERGENIDKAKAILDLVEKNK